MTTRTLSLSKQERAVDYSSTSTHSVPSPLLEYGYYGVMGYAILGASVGVSLEFLGVGMLVGIAALCIISLGSRATMVYAPLLYPLACATAFVTCQLVFHEEALLAGYVRPFFTWAVTLTVIQALIQRPRFLHRFAIVALGIGIALLPHLRMNYMGDVRIERAGLDRSVGLANPNDFAAWFGFCALYFTIVGIETARLGVRALAWATTIGCLYVVSLTVSRGALLAFAIAAIVALRHSLKRGFLPLLSLFFLGWLLSLSGIFEHAVTSYTARASVESGRFLVWPLAFERFLASPFVGVGVSHIDTYIFPLARSITPHNSFLFIALASGSVPLVFYILYWWRAAQGVRHIRSTLPAEAAFCLPLLVYTLLVALEANFSFMKPWAAVALALALTGHLTAQTSTVSRRFVHGHLERRLSRAHMPARLARPPRYSRPYATRD